MIRTLLLFLATAAVFASSQADETEFSRERRNTIDMFQVVERLETIEKSVDVLEGELGSLPETLGALLSSLDANSASLGRIDDLVNTAAENAAAIAKIRSDIDSRVRDATAPLQSRVQGIGSQVGGIDAKVKADLNSFQSTLTSTVDNLKQTTAADITKLKTDTTTALANAGETTIFVNWNRGTCNAQNGHKVTTLYTGIAWGSRHDQSGGGSTILCLKRGENGGRNDETDENDQMRPVSTDNCGSYANIGSCNRIVNCGLCKIEQHCYDNWGSTNCEVSGYKATYTGWTYGSHHGHPGNQNRICLDTQQQLSHNEGGHGSYIYPSVNRDYHGRSARSIPCAKCCKTAN